ncbi:hypothetical protein BST97_15415 [Nonlabens spongiae]|uniref:RDD domain-containing protein n=1 Tax=Nonlabens spongiae TaxID=331648 RepID=A0A1W6MNX1_9FLAO|nr:RDD family protein [Nonlabens spongiae]ARN79262.1 hypothetical protein BST97_15415 [Nonlabens spongiae]
MELKELHYQGFSSRWKSFLIDNIIVGLFLTAVSFINLSFHRDFSVYLISNIIALSYKPLMETFFGATLGKMLINLKVVDYDGNSINAAQAWLRHIFRISQFLLSVFFYYAAFHDPILLDTEGYADFQTEFLDAYAGVGYISNALFFILLAEVLFMNMDPMHRSLHDRIAKTVVVKAE